MQKTDLSGITVEKILQTAEMFKGFKKNLLCLNISMESIIRKGLK